MFNGFQFYLIFLPLDFLSYTSKAFILLIMHFSETFLDMKLLQFIAENFCVNKDNFDEWPGSLSLQIRPIL